jgi:hypothetical protein
MLTAGAMFVVLVGNAVKDAGEGFGTLAGVIGTGGIALRTYQI